MTEPDTRIDLTGKTVVITGASSGIGAAAARRLAAQGATVVPVGRSPQRTAQVAAELGTEPLIADFAHLDQVRQLADTLLDRYPRIDVLADNAGGLVSTRQLSADGHELTFQANHLAPFLLTTLLLPRLRDNAGDGPVRIITTSSLGNRFGKLRLDDLEWEQRRYGGGWLAYGTTKLMNILFTRELARRTQGTGIQAFCFHPTAIHRGQRGPTGTATRFADSSRLVRLIPKALLRRVQLTGEDGAEPLIWLAATPGVPAVSGAYFHGFKPNATVNPQADDPELAAQLWDRSTELVQEQLRSRACADHAGTLTCRRRPRWPGARPSPACRSQRTPGSP
jgi:NAD(P)-dependent dehydrogenase (short-subunit alcohol dehydrogenase family)